MEFGENNNSNSDQEPLLCCHDEVADEKSRNVAALCCCEYIDKDNKRFHLLACCCNCVDFDIVFTNFITGRNISTQNKRNMILTCRDRLRIPWRGGAKQISLDAVVPALLLPIIIATAALNAYAATSLIVITTLALVVAHQRVQQRLARTRFFCMWLFWSLVYMIVLFESTVPLLELLPEENLLLVILSVSALFCLWRTRQGAVLNQVQQRTSTAACVDELPDIVEENEGPLPYTMESDTEACLSQPSMCATCRKYVAPRTSHCSLCGACILRRDHHNYWLDCCIGQCNHCYYILSMFFGASALLLGANLTLTAVCHPFLVQRLFGMPIMVPDDCSEVFDEYELSVAFVIAVYAILMALYVLAALLQQIYLISIGLTMHERRNGQQHNRKSIWTNWKNLFVFRSI